MWKHQKSTNLLTRLVLLFVVSAQLLETARALSDKRLCADEHCKKIISMGTGLIGYRSGEEGMISFSINSLIRIKSKGAGSNPEIWGIEVNGREGYAPKKYIRETKVYVREKDLTFVVDVEQKTKVPVLSTSEKAVEQGSVSETATTMPLNLTSTESTEHILSKTSNEPISADNVPVATPVLSQISNGTQEQIFSNQNSGNETNLQNNELYSSNNAGGNEKDVQNTVETAVKPENKREGEESSEQQIKNKEFNINEERKQNENAVDEQENEVKESSFKNEKNISESTTELIKETKIEIETPKETISLKAPHNADNESLLGEHSYVSGNSLKSSAAAAEDQQADDVRPSKSNTEVENAVNKKDETISIAPTNVDSKGLVEEYNSANQNSSSAAEKPDANKLDNLQSTSDYNKSHMTEDNNQTNTAPTDSKEEKQNIVPNSIYENTEASTHSSVRPLEDDLNKTQIEPHLASETMETNKLESEKEEQLHQASSENPIQQSNIDNETVVNYATKVEPVVIAGLSADDEVNLTPKTAAGSSESKGKESSDELQQIDDTNENDDKVIRHEFNPTETGSNAGDIEKNSDEIKTSSNAAIENSKAYDGPSHIKQEAKLNDTSLEDSNSINFHHQDKIKNKVDEDVPSSNSIENADEQQMDNKNSIPTENEIYHKSSANAELVETEIVAEASYEPSKELPSQVAENINPTTFVPTGDVPLNTPLPTYQDYISTSVPPNDNQADHFEHSQENSNAIDSANSAPTAMANEEAQPRDGKNENTKTASPLDNLEPKENKGLFATIMGTVNNMLTNNRKKQNEYEFDGDDELDRILYSQGNAQKNNIEKLNEETSFPYCENIGPNGDCPESSEGLDGLDSASQFHHNAAPPLIGSDITMEAFLSTMASKMIEMSQTIAFLGVAAAASLFFVFGYYCFCNSSREGALLLRLNQLESSLLASHKENAILKHNLMSTRQKLASIEDNSFGSNDMVASLKKELEEELLEKPKLQEQIAVLQKELENAADAGIELNKIVSELLSNQTGDESIISSVEELQRQLNEQQNTIYEINASLAEKSRENSELQLMIAEQNARYEAELANVQRDNDELEHEKGNLVARLEEMKTDFDKDITAALEGKNMEIKRLQNDILDLSNKLEHEHTKWQTSVAKIEALEECLKNVRKDPKVNISEVIDVANVKAQLIEAQKMCKSLKERFENELDSRKLVENQLEMVSAEVEKLKQDFNQSEKDKLEAQTRLEVLSNYFKDKENQLQKELSLKDALWLKQQGETTTTVDRVTAMQEEIQSLKSQNDSLRAEIEAQLAAHKAQTGTLENRAHETWLAARQSDRRYEEARAEATALRRKLTALAGGSVSESNKVSVGPVAMGDELTQAPSPIHMESPGSAMLGRMPPPPPFLPPPFMGPPPPFMGMPPPPPFVPPGEMRPAPLGRIMSPPPQRSGRFSPQHLDYDDDYLDYEGNNTWQRYTYSPPPRTYRSLSPTDSRYNYGTERDLMSTYDTETDFSPPPSPRESRRRAGNSSERIDSNTKISYGNTHKFNSSGKGPLSSGSENSFNAHSHNDTKIKKGNITVGGKNIV